MRSVMSAKLNCGNPVWFVKTAVGTGQHCTFIAASSGTEAPSEHRPKLE